MKPQDNENHGNQIPEADYSNGLDEVVIADGFGGNNLKSTDSENYTEHIAYLSKSDGVNKKVQRYTNTSSSSVYDDLDDYIYNHRRKVKHKTRRSDNSIDKFMDSMYLNPKRSNKTSKKSRKKKKVKMWKKILISVLSLLLAVIIALIVTVAVLDHKGKNELLKKNDVIDVQVPEDADQYENGKYIVTGDGRKFEYNENITTILCMGIDEQDFGKDDLAGDGGSADALFLIAMDTLNGTTKVINISRDIMTDISVYSKDGNYVGSKNMQLCLAYSYGDGYHKSCENQVQAVSNLFYNIPINSYLSLDLSGIGPINDSVGGVTVVSPETIGPFVEGGTYTLYGQNAEIFVRKRTMDTVNANNLRMERQKIYLESFANILIANTKKDVKTPLNLFETATPYICTNLDASKITYLGLNAIRGNYNSGTFEVQRIEGESKMGKKYAEFYPDEEKFFETFLDVFYKPAE